MQNSKLKIFNNPLKCRFATTINPYADLATKDGEYSDYIYENQYSAVAESRRLDGSKAWDGYYLSYAKGYLCDEAQPL